MWHVHLANFTILKAHNAKIVRAIALNALLLQFVLPVLRSFIWVTTLALHVLPIVTTAQLLNNVQRVQQIIIGMRFKKHVWHVHLANFTILKAHNAKIVRAIALNALLLQFVLPVLRSFIWVTTLALHVLPIATTAQQLNNVQRVQQIIIGMRLKKHVWHVHLANFTILKAHNAKIVQAIALNALLLQFVLPVLEVLFEWQVCMCFEWHVHALNAYNVFIPMIICWTRCTLKSMLWHVNNWQTCSASGVVTQSSQCEDCSSNCTECTSATVCTTCASKFYLSDNACAACFAIPMIMQQLYIITAVFNNWQHMQRKRCHSNKTSKHMYKL